MKAETISESYLQVGDTEIRANDIEEYVKEHNNIKKEIERLKHREKELKYFNDILENQNLDKAKIIKEVREYVEKYEVINGYYDSNYDGENDTYSHDLVKEDILEILDKEKGNGN